MTLTTDRGSLRELQQDEPKREENQALSYDIVRTLKEVAITNDPPGEIDSQVISSAFYNCFNYSVLGARRSSGLNLAIGVTSAQPGEGTTLVASNLAVSLALSCRRGCVIVDLNVQAPKLHRVFGTHFAPGLVESLGETTVHVSRTGIEQLYVLPSGDLNGSLFPRHAHSNGESSTSMGLEQVPAFRDVLYSLRQEFEFVIVDMPAIQEPAIPVLLTNQMDGIIVVVNANKTKHEDIQKMLQKVNHNQVIGFVFNRVSKELIM